MSSFFEKIGASARAANEKTGSITIMLGQATYFSLFPPYKLRNIFKQMEFVGVKSLFVVILTGAFTGMVLAMQSHHALQNFGAEVMVGPAVALSMTRELGPVISSLMVAGRAGSAMATELGTMRVSEQIDAITTMGLNPVKYLVVPRIIAGICMLPLLVIIADFCGILGGYFVATNLLDINAGVYISSTIEHMEMSDIFNGLLKAVVFGLIISLMGAFHGFYAKGGAEGVGRAATDAVVSGCVLILIFDYILTSMMF
ncbi:MAG: ABC transporter permease [Deltaproteobacteria bacterium]|nr:ABC transporter permease [Deltaproteobacteria bacterium]